MHLASAFGDLALVSFEVEVEMGERVVLDGARLVAQGVEFGEVRARRLALGDETVLDVEERLLQRGVGERPRGGFFEVLRWRAHAPPLARA